MLARSFRGVTTLILLLLAVGSHEAHGASNSSIVFGMSAPLNASTHPAAQLSVQFAAGINLAFKEVNEKYGGVNGHQLELLVQEDNNTLATTMSNVANMIDNLGVFAIAGVIGAEQSQGAFQLFFCIFLFFHLCFFCLC
jgi:ABC-type branched-subunit amino acid transport system substrate-binding protein